MFLLPRKEPTVSTKQRLDAEALRKRYAKTFGRPLESVCVVYLDDEDAEVSAAGYPRWTLGTSTEAWNAATGASFTNPKGFR
jgi:hypothetical protein